MSFLQQFVKILRLLYGARVAVKQEAVGAIGASGARRDHAVDDIVGNEASGGDDRAGFEPERRAGGDFRAQHVTRRDGWDFVFEPLNDEAALRALASSQGGRREE